MPFPVAAAIMGGTSLLGGVLGNKGAKKAANAQVSALREGLALQDRQFQQTREDFAPWRAAGGAAIGDLYAMTRPGFDYTASPGYQFRLGEGMRAVENSAAARGLLQSGGTLKGLERYAQGVAADDYDRQFNRVASVAAGGQQANATVAGAGSNYANAGSNLLGQIGQARASGYAGQNQAIQGTLGNLFSLYSMGGFGKGF